MKVMFIAAEAAPFAKAGGLGDVIGSLPIELAKKDVDVRVILPYYRDIPQQYKDLMRKVGSCHVKIGWRDQPANVWELEHRGVRFYFIDQPYYFDRSGLYGYFDDGERFAFLSQAALSVIEKTNFNPDVIHAHDWHTALVPFFVKEFYQKKGIFEKTKTVFTIHNLAYQGSFPPDFIEDVLGLSWDYYTEDKLEYRDSVNLMKGGILYADAVTTVSSTYAEEVQTEEWGAGLSQILQNASNKFVGILNGMDMESYNPSKDSALMETFDSEQLEKRKKNKEKLLNDFNIMGGEEALLIGMVSRMTWEKGFDLISEIIPQLVYSGAKMIILGTGDPKYEALIESLKERYPHALAVITEFDESLARNIYGSSDLFLMPSIFEPCGISQMIAMRYGSIPLVHCTGGLKDTVIPYDRNTREGLGFVFPEMTAESFCSTYKEALTLYKDQSAWKNLMKQAMQVDYSWSESVKKYIQLYEQVTRGEA